jgi:hypothetical protein
MRPGAYQVPQEVVAVAETIDRLTSPIVRACEDAWGAIQRREGDIPSVAIVVASRNRRPVYGHYARSAWVLTPNGKAPAKPKVQDYRAEVLIASEALNRGGRLVFETLLHEAVHGQCHVRQIKDTDTQGRYHNVRFKGAAEAVGLVCEKSERFGCITSDVTPETAKRYKAAISKLDKTLMAYRHEKVGRGKPPDRNYMKLGCDCGRLIRVSRSTHDEGPIMCGNCGETFEDPDEA